MATGRVIQTDNIDGLLVTKNFLSNGLATLNTTGWTTFNAVRSSNAVDGVDAVSTTGGHGLPLGVYVQVKILTVATPCGLTAGNTYYMNAYTSTLASVHTTPGALQINITADSAITWAETRPAAPYGTANITWGVTTTNPISDAKSFLLTKDAANRQYQGVMTDFTIDNAYKAKVLNTYMDYIVDSGTFVAGSNTTDSDVIIYLYDVTNNQVIEPSSYKLLSNSTTIADRYSSSFQTPYNSTSYRLVILVASASTAAYAIKMDNIGVSPSNYVYGTPITDDTATTFTLANAGNATVSGTVSKLGNKGLFSGTITIGSSLPTGNITLNLPAGNTMTISTGYVNSQISALRGTTTYSASAARSSATSVIFGGPNSAVWNATVPATWAAGDAIKFDILVPILGWSSSVQVSDGYDGRVVTFRKDNANTATTYATGSTSDITWLNATSSVSDDVGGWNGTFYTIRTAGYYKLSTQFVLNGFTYTPGLQYDVFWANSSNNTIYDNAQFTMGSGTTVRVAGGVVSPPLWFNAGQTLKPRYFNGTGVNNSFQSLIIGIEKLSGSPTISATETVAMNYTGAPPTGTLTNNTTQNTIFGTKRTDTHGIYNTSTGIATIPVAGYYTMQFKTRVNGTFSATNDYLGTIISNITTGIGYATNTSPTLNSLILGQTLVQGVWCNAGEQIQTRVYVGGTGTGLSYSSDSSQHEFSIVKVK